MEYYYIKSFHLISIIIWISSLVYLSKVLFFRQKLMQKNDNTLVQKLIKEEVFIYRYIFSSAFLFAVISGIVLVSLNKEILQTGFWIYIKFFFLSLLAIIHHYIKIYMKKLSNNDLIEDKNFNSLNIYACIFLSIVVLLTITKFV